MTSFRDMVAANVPCPTRLRKATAWQASNLQFSIQNFDADLFLPLDVSCSMFDVRRFRADL
jgi:hypothetical protein